MDRPCHSGKTVCFVALRMFVRVRGVSSREMYSAVIVRFRCVVHVVLPFEVFHVFCRWAYAMIIFGGIRAR